MPLMTGNTYPHRVALKALGGTWDPAQKGWDIPIHHAEQAQQLIDSVPPGSIGTWRRTRPRTCKTCGSGIRYGVYCGKCEYSR